MSLNAFGAGLLLEETMQHFVQYMNASIILDVFQYNVFAIGYPSVAGNTISTLRTAAEPFYKFFVAFVENTWFFLTKGWLYVVLGSIILIAGVITGLYRTFRIRYGEYDPSPASIIRKALEARGFLPFLLRAGILSSLVWWLLSTYLPPSELGEGATLGYGIGGGILLALFYIRLTSDLNKKAINTKIPDEILVWAFAGGCFGLALCLFGIPLIVFGGSIVTTNVSKSIAVVCLLLSIPFGAITGGSIGGIIHGVVLISSFVTLILSRFVLLIGSRLMFPLLGFKTIICQHCLRYTVPFRSHYREGIRYCEHCQKEVERTNISGKVLFTFGTFTLKLGDQEVHLTNPRFAVLKQPGRVFICSNPGFKSVEKIVDVSEVYIDTKTCDPRKLERFITYMVHYGLQSVKVFYKGDLDDFDEHLRNALRNTFECIELEGNV